MHWTEKIRNHEKGLICMGDFPYYILIQVFLLRHKFYSVWDSIIQMLFLSNFFDFWRFLSSESKEICVYICNCCEPDARKRPQLIQLFHWKSQNVNKRHRKCFHQVTLVCPDNLCWQTRSDILSVLGCSVNGSSIITSLMGLEWGQSFMTLCFIASPGISVLKWERWRYFLWSYFLTRGCLWLMAFSRQSHLGNPKE